MNGLREGKANDEGLDILRVIGRGGDVDPTEVRPGDPSQALDDQEGLAEVVKLLQHVISKIDDCVRTNDLYRSKGEGLSRAKKIANTLLNVRDDLQSFVTEAEDGSRGLSMRELVRTIDGLERWKNELTNSEIIQQFLNDAVKNLRMFYVTLAYDSSRYEKKKDCKLRFPTVPVTPFQNTVFTTKLHGAEEGPRWIDALPNVKREAIMGAMKEFISFMQKCVDCGTDFEVKAKPVGVVFKYKCPQCGHSYSAMWDK